MLTAHDTAAILRVVAPAFAHTRSPTRKSGGNQKAPLVVIMRFSSMHSEAILAITAIKPARQHRQGLAQRGGQDAAGNRGENMCVCF